MADFDTLKAWAREDWLAWATYRDGMAEDFAFRDGHQWRQEDINPDRLPIVFNRVATIIASVSGSEINNRTEVRFLPREIGDVQPNEVLTAGAEWFRDQGDAEDEESASFDDLLICGIGFTETFLDFDYDDEGDPRVERMPPREMFWDCHARRKGLQDASRLGRVRSIPALEAREMFPGKQDADIHCGWIDEPVKDWRDDHVPWDGNAADVARKELTVVQIQWRERQRVTEYVDPTTGERQEMPAKDWAKLAKRLEEVGMSADTMPHRDVKRWVWRQAFLGNDEILEQNQPCPEASTFRAMTGHWDATDRRWYGLLSGMKDPQRFANKWLSQALHIINSNAKGGVMLETDAVEDAREFEESWAAADGVTYMRPGAITGGKVMPKPTAQWPAAIMNLTEFAISSIRDVSGVNLEILGMREANQAGVLEFQRRQSAMTTLAFYFDALRYYRKQQGRVILSFLQNHIAPTGRLVRIVRDGAQQYVPLAIEDGTRKYDVIVDDSPSAPNEKERAWAVLEKMLPAFKDIIPPELWGEILEFSPLPGKLVDSLREISERQAQQPPDPRQEIEMRQAQADVSETESKAALNMAKVQSEQVDAQVAQANSARDAVMAMMPQPRMNGAMNGF